MKKNLIKLGKFFIGIMLIGIFSDFWGIFLGYFLGIDFGSIVGTKAFSGKSVKEMRTDGKEKGKDAVLFKLSK